VINDRYVIHNRILPLFYAFPPLTTRVHLQLAFVIKALMGMRMEEYFESRTLKYSTRIVITPLFTTVPVYFGAWLSGFVEAEASFAIRSGSLGFTFTIGQLNDLYLMEAILLFFGQSHLTVHHKVNSARPIYFIQIANIKGVTTVVEHLLDYPLQGYKHYQLAIVIRHSKALSHFKHHF
jgi:hypothetical protein